MSLKDLFDINKLVEYAGYGSLAAVGLLGAYYSVVVWRRVVKVRFRAEQDQDVFLDEIEGHLLKGDFDATASVCEGNPRVIPQLVLLACLNRALGFAKVQQLIEERFQRDVMADLEYKMSWVHTAIKSAPMLGLWGTVTGMMAAFGKLSTVKNVEPTALAGDISFALVTTIIGLTISIPLLVLVAAINIRIRKMETLTAAGLNRFVEMLQIALSRSSARRR